MRFSPWIIVLVLAPSGAAVAADAKTAAQSSAPLDAAFFLQGEYMGGLQTADVDSSQTGLQIIALGDGKFEAVEYAYPFGVLLARFKFGDIGVDDIGGNFGLRAGQ